MSRATIAVIAAQPGAVTEAVLASATSIAPTALWAPLSAPRWMAALPGAIGRYAQRRRAPHARASTMLLGVEAGVRVWARGQTDRRYRGELALRVAIDAWAAREVARSRPRLVIASTLAARATFAAARAVGAATVLVLDLPLLRALHRDLDRAIAAWPTRGFLRRYRAPSWAIARQEAERAMADLVVVRGAYAHALCAADGIARIARLPTRAPRIAQHGKTRRLRLAGVAFARHGVDTALAVASQLGAELVVRVGDDSEPRDLATRPGVVVDRDGALPVDAIISPAICECYPAELATVGVPVIASPMASLDGRGPDPYDAAAFAAAVRSASPTPAFAAPPLAPQLAALIR